MDGDAAQSGPTCGTSLAILHCKHSFLYFSRVFVLMMEHSQAYPVDTRLYL